MPEDFETTKFEMPEDPNKDIKDDGLIQDTGIVAQDMGAKSENSAPYDETKSDINGADLAPDDGTGLIFSEEISSENGKTKDSVRVEQPDEVEDTPRAEENGGDGQYETPVPPQENSAYSQTDSDQSETAQAVPPHNEHGVNGQDIPYGFPQPNAGEQSEAQTSNIPYGSIPTNIYPPYLVFYDEYGRPVQLYPYPPQTPNYGYYNGIVGDPRSTMSGTQPPNTPPKKKHTGLMLFAMSGVTVAVAVILAVLVFFISSDYDDSIVADGGSSEESSSAYQDSNDLSSAPEASADPDGPQLSVESAVEADTSTPAITAYEIASPSVVGVTAYEAGTDYVLTQSSEGSGIILTEDGYIATNSHVIDDSTDTGVMITLSTGDQYLATVIGIDTKTDIAVVKIDADGLAAASFADSDSLIIGQAAYAIGNPGGLEFSNSLTQGTISALDRTLSSNVYVHYIQTDAAINPGNSGGALINEAGQVVGMNTAKIVGTDYEGMGFAIPSNQVLEIVNSLIKYGYVKDRATLDIEGTTSTLYNSKVNGVPQGMIITSIYEESPLYLTEAITGDIITQIDDYVIESVADVVDALKNYKPGDEVEITLYRTKENSPTGAYEYTVTISLNAETGE